MVLQNEKNNYIEYTIRGDRCENLSLENYLDIIRPYLTDLINDHKPTAELNNDRDTERGEWKFQLVMLNNSISVKFLWVVTQMMSLIYFLIQF